MTNVITFPRGRRALEAYQGTAERIAARVDELEDLIAGLGVLRDMGSEDADLAVEAVLDVPIVKQLRISWELLEALMLGEGLEPEAVLEPVLGVYRREVVRQALLG